FFSSRRRHTRFSRDWSSDVCSSDLAWKRQRLQHVDGNGHMVVDDFPFFRRQGAALDAKVVNLIFREQRLLPAITVAPAERGNALHPDLVVVSHELAA